MVDLDGLIGRLARDLSSTGLDLEVGVFDLAEQTWLAGGQDEAPRDFGDEGWILVLPGRQKLMPRGDDETRVVAIIEEVQVWAMDELGSGWPELHDEDGRFVALLQPMIVGDDCVWAAHGIPQQRVGSLASSVSVVPRHS